MLGADDQVIFGAVHAQGPPPQTDGALFGHGEKPRARHAAMTRPQHLLRAAIARQQLVTRPQILDRDLACFGAQPRARRETDDRGPFGRGHAHGPLRAMQNRQITLRWGHLTQKQQHRLGRITQIDGNDGEKLALIRDDKCPAKDRVGLIGGNFGGAGCGALHQLAHHPCRAGAQLGMLGAVMQQQRATLACQGHRATMPPPCHAFGKMKLPLRRIPIQHGLRPCDHERAPKARSHCPASYSLRGQPLIGHAFRKGYQK